MDFFKHELMTGEKMLLRTRPHWIIFSTAVGWLVFSLIIFIYSTLHSFGNFQLAMAPSIFKIASWLTLILGVLYLINAVITYYFTEYVITNRRIMVRRGLIARNTRELLLQKVEGVDLVRTILGRMLGYGTIVVTGVGGSKDFFSNVPTPLQFRKLAQEQIENLILGSNERNK